MVLTLYVGCHSNSPHCSMSFHSSSGGTRHCMTTATDAAAAVADAAAAAACRIRRLLYSLFLIIQNNLWLI